ncbi:MAG: nucleotidyl transferase AbiEii/AbiGii toxin family protein [Candidatus Margulisiibacteriota bacterium]|nr:nucleotidyl transferase AbiEii/AbiGii toxin family protein [Candidatus Margulisiibacteriota bacterium]
MSWKWKKGEQLYYEDVFRKLQEKNVRYLLIGGIAVNLWGIERATGDIDLAVAMDSKNILNLVEAVKELGFIPKVPVKPEELAVPEKRKEWMEEKNMKVFSFQHPDNPFVLIDIMIDNPFNFEGMFSRRSTMESKGTKLSVVAVDDLIKLKEIAGREQDLSDIEALKKFVKGE